MAHDAETKRKARSAYVFQGLSLEAAAQHAAVSFGTASRWKREAKAEGDDWDKARNAALLSERGSEAVSNLMLQHFHALFESTVESIMRDEAATGLAKSESMSRLADAYSKTMSAARKSSPEVSKLAVAIDVIHLLTEYVGKKHPQHAPILIEILAPFGQHVTQVLS